MLPHIILVLLVVCNVGICVFCPFSFVFFRVSFSLLWAPYWAAYNNLIESFPVISLYMPAQLRGSCGHLKGKYDSHLTCINCAGCSRYNSCVECLSWTDSIWTLAESVVHLKAEAWARRRSPKENSRRGLLLNALQGLNLLMTRPGHKLSVLMMTLLRENRHQFCLGHHRGEI